MKKIGLNLFLSLLLFCTNSLQAQDQWSVLNTLSMEERVEANGDTVLVPLFNPEILALEGKRIELEVEVLEAQLEDDFLILYAFEQKDLCGGFDVGRAVEVPLDKKLQKGKNYRVSGVLALNRENRERLIYSLSEVKILP